jgi:hypothetical protein
MAKIPLPKNAKKGQTFTHGGCRYQVVTRKTAAGGYKKGARKVSGTTSKPKTTKRSNTKRKTTAKRNPSNPPISRTEKMALMMALGCDGLSPTTKKNIKKVLGSHGGTTKSRRK